MKLFILSDADSIHTKRWVTSLAEYGNEIFLFSLSNGTATEYLRYSHIKVYCCGIDTSTNLLSKSSYLNVVWIIKRKIKQFSPDILHAHYASSYGLLGALTGFHPYIISVWGSDVYEFPKNNIFTNLLLKYNLSRADKILSTSHIMAQETARYTDKHIDVTPFGVDVNLFKKIENINNDFFIVGNVKTLAPKYGIDILIKAYKIIVENNKSLKTKLVIVGDGSHKNEYIALVQDLNLVDRVKFVGKVPNNKLVRYYNQFSVFVSPSDSESFGVVAVEAMACECPVVTSDADGFTEVVKDGETGFIVPKRDVELTAKAIQRFIDEPRLKEIMGKNGRKRVLDLYSWENNVSTMIKIYENIINEYTSN